MDGSLCKYQLESGGKRFRVILALIASKMFGLSKDISKSIAISCEFIHNASLIHDDLQDRDLLEEDFQQYGMIWRSHCNKSRRLLHC